MERELLTTPGPGEAAAEHAAAAGTWLVVGDPADADRLQDLLPAEWQAHTRAVPDYLAALGVLATEPARVVIGHWEAVSDMAGSTARSLRELAPDAALLVVASADDDDAPADAEAAGFDATLPAPLTLQQLAGALGLATDGDHPAPPLPTGLNGTHGHDHAPAASRDGGEMLGDVDLIDAILSGGGLQPTAMELVRQRSGIRGIAFTPRVEDVPPGHLSQRVTLRGNDFGLLHAPAVTDADDPAADPAADLAADLAAWAAWLAHWKTMAEQFSLLKDLSMRDPLTGVWNRRYFDRFLQRILDWAARERSPVTLLVFDIDDFKHYNDRYGHSAGDDILRECARLMQSVVREHDVVARIGGDEFAVIFWDSDPRQGPRKEGSRHPENVVKAATRFREAICQHKFPKLLDEAPGTLTISGGLASFPWDGRTPEELLDRADQMAMESKRHGKNAIRLGPGMERDYRGESRDGD